MISARILADSINPAGSRLTSFLATYPRFIHSEFMTHRVFSRNAASSRAIPFRRMLKDINDHPAMPEYWGVEKPGMQSGEAMNETDCRVTINNIDQIRRFVCHWIEQTKGATDLHKSIANRYLEPWAHITVLATATDKGLANFFALRAHPAAQPEFQVLAYQMLAQYIEHKPTRLYWGEWHIPSFGGNPMVVIGGSGISDEIKIATARCARLSYLTFDGEHSPEKDIKLHDDLLANKHMSPFEHCAQAREETPMPSNFDAWEDDNGPFLASSHWLQYRKMIEGENQTNVDLHAILAAKPNWITI